jgi:GxxExxY protein
VECRELTRTIIGYAMKVHRKLGYGFLESVYQNALRNERLAAGLDVKCYCRLTVWYEGQPVGEFVADMIVEGLILIENKAVATLNTAHSAQLVNYLVATGIDIGLLWNFGARNLEFKRRTRFYDRRADAPFWSSG